MHTASRIGHNGAFTRGRGCRVIIQYKKLEHNSSDHIEWLYACNFDSRLGSTTVFLGLSSLCVAVQRPRFAFLR